MRLIRKTLSTASVVALIATSSLSVYADDLAEPTLVNNDAVIDNSVPTETSEDLSVASVNVNNTNDLDINLNTSYSSDTEPEVKLNKNSDLSGFLSTEDLKVANLVLEDELLPNTSYDLLTILGAEGNITFTTPELLEGAEINNPKYIEGEDNIISIKIIDPKTLEVTFSKDIEEETIEFNFLRELKIKETISDADNGIIKLFTQDKLSSNSNYNITFTELNDISGTKILETNAIYQFSTFDVEEGPVEEVELNSAPEEKVVAVEEVVTKKLPDTGTKEVFIFMLALFLGAIVVIRKKDIKV